MSPTASYGLLLFHTFESLYNLIGQDYDH